MGSVATLGIDGSFAATIIFQSGCHVCLTAPAERARELAESATDLGIAMIHRSMAENYSILAQYEAGERPALFIVKD